MPEVRVLSSAGIARHRQSYDPVRLPSGPSPSAMSKPRPPTARVSLDYPHHPSRVPCPIPRQTEQVLVTIASLFARPSPGKRRVGICIDSFEACSDFTRVTAHWIAQPPKAAFVTRLRTGGYPTDPLVSYQINRQLSGWNLPPLVTRAFEAHSCPRHKPRMPPLSVVLTLWLSITPAVGLASLPSNSRVSITRRWLMRGQSPNALHIADG